jgi:hypothetical protein
MEDLNAKPPARQTRTTKTDMYEESVRQWLATDLTAPRKQRHTAHRADEYPILVKYEFIVDVVPRALASPPV